MSRLFALSPFACYFEHTKHWNRPCPTLSRTHFQASNISSGHDHWSIRVRINVRQFNFNFSLTNSRRHTHTFDGICVTNTKNSLNPFVEQSHRHGLSPSQMSCKYGFSTKNSIWNGVVKRLPAKLMRDNSGKPWKVSLRIIVNLYIMRT